MMTFTWGDRVLFRIGRYKVDLRKRQRAEGYQMIALFLTTAGLFFAVAGEVQLAAPLTVLGCAWAVVKPFSKERRRRGQT